MKLIDKDALIVEIEKLIEEIYAGQPFDSLNREKQVALWYVISIMSSINFLEVKEVDLKKEIKNFTEDLFHKAFDADKSKDDFWNDMAIVIEYAAKHFFELGMSVSNKV